ncbi:MAG: biotin/lipoyl-containing protein, partial [Vicinamibacteria bacterium]
MRASRTSCRRARSKRRSLERRRAAAAPDGPPRGRGMFVFRRSPPRLRGGARRREAASLGEHRPLSLELAVPQLGEGLREVRIVEILRRAGDAVARGEPMYVVETDKSTVELEA